MLFGRFCAQQGQVIINPPNRVLQQVIKAYLFAGAVFENKLTSLGI